MTYYIMKEGYNVKTIDAKMPLKFMAYYVTQDLTCFIYVKSMEVLCHIDSFRQNERAKGGLTASTMNVPLPATESIVNYFRCHLKSDPTNDIFTPIEVGSLKPVDDYTEEEIKQMCDMLLEIYEYVDRIRGTEAVVPLGIDL